MKVAQHFSAGKMMQKTRPSRSGTIEPLGSLSRIRLHEYKQPSIVPDGANCLLKTLPSNKLLGYFHRVPGTGLFTLRRIRANLLASRYVDEHANAFGTRSRLRKLRRAPGFNVYLVGTAAIRQPPDLVGLRLLSHSAKNPGCCLY
jgi:hypothetical protein